MTPPSERETFADLLPAVYRHLLPPFFAHAAIREERATCANCAMCDPHGGDGDGATYFRPDAKCCTYQPFLPNYLAGAVLRDDDPALAEGARRVRARIAQRIGVTPRWLHPGRKYSLLFEAARASSFGRSTTLRCSFFEPQGGLCTIWKHRDAACSTFFCKHRGGGDGKIFWVALESWLAYVERQLAAYAVTTLAPELEEPDMTRGLITREDLEDRPPSESDYATYWGAWLGREAELYVRCYELIAGLDRATFERLLGDGGNERLSAVAAKHAALVAPVLAERLTLNPELVARPVEGGVVVTSYSSYDPMMLSDALHEVLRQLSARERVVDVLARLKRDHDIELPEGLLLSLQQMRVVVPVSAESENRPPDDTGTPH
jgi:Fe-S-cluster containining protein